MKGDNNSKEETDASEEEEKGFIESGDEEKTDYSHPVDEESKTSHEGDEDEDDPTERNPEQSEEKSGDVRDDEESRTSHEGDEIEDDPTESNPEKSEEKSGDVRDDEESRTSHGGNEVDDDSSESNPEQSDEKSDDVKDYEESAEDMKDGNHVEGLFDHQGGELSLSNHDCILRIPPGALEKGSPTKITLEVLTELPDDLELEDDEMVVSSGFKCLPSGLHFKKPVKLIMPHCAVLQDPGRVKTILHSWSHQTGKIENIPQTSASCTVHQHHFELMLEHFSEGWLTMLWHWIFTKGKLMSCMPFLPNTMPANRIPLMKLRLENKSYQSVTYTKGRQYQPALDKGEEIMIEWKDLTVHCDHTTDSQKQKVLEKHDLFSTTESVTSFPLDMHSKEDNIIVTLKLTQTRSKEMMFNTGCIAASSKANNRDAGELADRECKVSEKEFLALAKSIESARYLDVGIHLQIKHAELEDIRERCRSDQDALMKVLMKWRVKQPPDTDIRSSLADKLEEVGLQELSGRLRNGTLVTS